MRCFFGCLVWLVSSLAAAQSSLPVAPTDGDFDPTAKPPELLDVTVTQRIGSVVPLNGVLRDEQGGAITLGQLLSEGRPVLLDLGYYECPLICPTVKRGIAKAVGESGRTLGEDYTIVSVSIDPEETPAVARLEQSKTSRLPDLAGVENVAAHWRFLTGPEPAVAAIAQAVGYGYQYLPKQDEFGHAPVIIFLSEDGTVSSYLPGSLFPKQQFDLAIGDAADGRSGSVFQQVLQWCYRFDPSRGKYVVVAMNVMKLSGVVMVLLMGSVIGWLFWLERKRRNRRGSAAG